MRDYCCQLFKQVGVPEAEAYINADSLVDADLKGIDSHGVSRMAIYLKRLRLRIVNPAVQLKVITESQGTAVYDACNSMGAAAACKVMEAAIDKARKTGVSFITVCNSNHYSAAAYFAEMALEHDMIGFTASNGPARIAPWGGTEPLFGTSPFAYAIPAGKELPIIADMASSVVARGKIIMAAKKEQQIPLGWARNKFGEDTTNAQDALEGSVLPFGGPKGYAIATMIEVLTGILAGSCFTTAIKDLYADFDNPTCTSHYFGAISLEAFGPVQEFKDTMDQFIVSVKNNPKAKGVEEILLPGERGLNMKKMRLQEGIPLPRITLDSLKYEGEVCGIPYDLE
ncbi:Malate/lactate/ureidoglycolate dehydrogenase, LDH2 family [Sporomusa malonica]|uniref:Malate/lactate/ureidoglycolate dehydrogenase, LDH2 family n=1 Tax=Sporomusa malonica TaxID=112901 RepID=A0A1W1ZKT9_9FIRM|nr:Malate/lactate/ureidoglycolate dehydrogenase, LDH2 family [Sporomusa malonica]